MFVVLLFKFLCEWKTSVSHSLSLDEEYLTDQVTLEIASVNIKTLTSDSGLIQQVRKMILEYELSYCC